MRMPNSDKSNECADDEEDDFRIAGYDWTADAEHIIEENYKICRPDWAPTMLEAAQLRQDLGCPELRADTLGIWPRNEHKDHYVIEGRVLCDSFHDPYGVVPDSIVKPGSDEYLQHLTTASEDGICLGCRWAVLAVALTEKQIELYDDDNAPSWTDSL